MGPGCSSNCRFKCHDRISTEQRQKVLDKFLALGDHVLQWRFIAQYATNSDPLQRKENVLHEDERRKNISHTFFLPIETSKIKVCKRMFLSTLSKLRMIIIDQRAIQIHIIFTQNLQCYFFFCTGVSAQLLLTVDKKRSSDEHFLNLSDERGKHHNRPFKVPEEAKNLVREHINMYPVIESHYCRKDTKRKYLEEGLSISKMYRMYKEYVGKKEQQPVSEQIYSIIFSKHFNYGFFKPKKDR